MKRRTRYLFIALGFVVFGIISPLIVLYVSGFSYDWETDQLTATGLLSVKTKPNKATILLDGEDVGTTPSTIRFLKPKDYNVVIRKEGYFDWSKKLELKSGKVTWASDRLPELNLIRQDPAPIIVASDVKDFFVGDDFALYLTETDLIKTDLAESAIKESVKLSASCERITASPSQNLILLTCGSNNYLYEQSDLTKLSFSLLPETKYVFGPENSLYSLEKEVLVKTDTENGTRQEIANRTTAFGFQANTLYRLESSVINDQSPKQTLISSPLYRPDQVQILMENVPAFTKSELLIARSKEIFLFADNVLYRVNERLEPLLSGITEIGFDSESPALTYTTGFELYAYDFNRGIGQLVVRHTGALRQPQGKTDIGYVLYINDNKIQASELDSRDHVNNYTLNTASDFRKYTTDPTHSFVYFLDGATLKFFSLR